MRTHDRTPAQDRTTKLPHYAGGGIPQYVILNLDERTAEEYLAPDPTAATYARSQTHPSGGTLRLHLAGDEHLEVSVDQLFPPR